MEVTIAAPTDAVLQTLLAKVAEMQATISALTNVVTAQSAATNQLAAAQLTAAQRMPMLATNVPPMIGTQQPFSGTAQTTISAIGFSLPPKATVRSAPTWAKEPSNIILAETSSAAQNTIATDSTATPKQYEATPSSTLGMDHGSELREKARAIYFAHYDTSIVMVHLRGLCLLTNEEGLRAQLGALQAAHRHATADYGIPHFK